MASGSLKYPIGYDGFAVNSARTADGEPDRDALASGDYVRTDLFDFSRVQYRDQREGLHLLSGGDLGVASEVFRFISMQGVISAADEQEGALEDQQRRLIHAFHVEETQILSPDTVGALPLDFWTPTDTPPTGFTSPVHEYFIARPVAYPALFERYGSGLTVRWGVELVCPDPRRYLYDETTVEFNGTDGWSQDMPNWATDTGRMVYPTVTVTTSGNGASNFTINDGTKMMVLDLSAAGAVHFDINCFTGAITKHNGDRKDAWRASSVLSIPFGIPAGGSSWTIGHRTNVTRVTVTYHQASA